MCRLAMPLQDLMEDAWGRAVRMKCGIDNATALLDIKQGWSKSMKYLRKHQRVSLSLMSEVFERDENDLDKINTDKGNNMTAFHYAVWGPRTQTAMPTAW